MILLYSSIVAGFSHFNSVKYSSTDIATGKFIGLRLNMISHGMGFNRLGRAADQRKALLRSLTTEALRHGRIITTLVKAKALRKPVDHMITLAKKGTLHHRRQALAYIFDKEVVRSLFNEAPERYKDRQGGYCRVIKEERPRTGDNAQMATFELV